MRWCLIALLLLVPAVHAAHISGNTYDNMLEPVRDVVLQVDSTPAQTYISKDGTYGFDLAPGIYNLTADYTSDSLQSYHAEEELNITGDGDFQCDIVMFPSLDDEERLAKGIDVNVSDVAQEPKPGSLFPLILGIILAAIAFVSLWLFRRKRRKPTRGDHDEVYSRVLTLLKKHRRMTQKEIRREVPMSEAKISLVLTELENKGIVTKIKKGRGNIIVLR